MPHTYDDQNIFAKILRGEIPNKTVTETDHTLAFEDIAPQAPHHVLVIPKGPYVTIDHFAAEANEVETMDFWRTFGRIIADLGVIDPGYRVLSNAGVHGLQEVPHFHLHVLAGRSLGPILVR